MLINYSNLSHYRVYNIFPSSCYYREAPRVYLHPEAEAQEWNTEEEGRHARMLCLRHQGQGEMV